MNKLCTLLALVLSLAAPAVAGIGDELGLSPFWDWKQIRTEHFRIVFPKELEAQARKAAAIYEAANRDLSLEMRWQPFRRVNVLLTDSTDAANGMTTPIGRFGMILFLTPPETYFATDSYDQWLKLLIYHEYTHFLNMDPTRGFYSFLRVVFGDVILPNSAWPSWMLEGYAVWNETRFTGSGRGRSPYWQGILRSAVEADALDRSDFIKLDQLQGDHPRYPSGEVAYLFGYHLMDEASKARAGALADLSERSSERVPYFINGNVENVTGKDWYALWDQWVAETKTQMRSELATLRSQPLSKVEPLDGTRDESFGATFSPDGNWLAYSLDTEDRWQTLKLRPWGADARAAQDVEDKFFGVGMAFTPDSGTLVYSSLSRWHLYYELSDLRAYDLRSGRKYWLTDGARAKDPDVSPDGKRIVYAQASDSGVDLMLASLARDSDGELRLEDAKKIVDAPAYDRIAQPKFARDGSGIVFSWKKYGQTGDDLYYYDLKSGSSRALVSDGRNNRFPAFDAKGGLWFVSDRTGVDNLYRFRGSLAAGDSGKAAAPELATNVVGALWLPAFRGEDLYASTLSKEGFSISRVSLAPGSITPGKVTVKAPEIAAPERVSPPPTAATEASYAVEDYSTLATLAPRQWAPLWLSDTNTDYVGAQVLGYDNTFRHEYFAFGAHDSTSKNWDYSVQYENRSLGASVLLYAQKLTTDVIGPSNSATSTASWTRENEAGANVSVPIAGTTAVVTPALGFKIERDIYSQRSSAGVEREVGRTRLVPQEDATVEWRDTRSSRLALVPERGHVTMAGVRRYDLDLGATDVYKGIFKHTQYFDLGGHTVLEPSVKAMKVNRKDFAFPDALAISRGKRSRILNPLYSDDFDEFGIRGYPSVAIASREAVTLATDLRFPIARIFRGWGTNPFFADQFWGQIFAEDTWRPTGSPKFQHLPSAGAGLRLGTELLLYVPLTFGLDYHYGFNKDAGGQGEVFFSVAASSVLPW